MYKRQAITEADVLGRIVPPDGANLTQAVARAVLEMHLDAETLARMDALAQKNQDGALTDVERDEMQTYIRVGHFLNLLHAKARRSLSEQGAA